MFSETYRPRHLIEIVGQNDAVSELRRFAESWNRGNPSWRSATLYGPPGDGKTSAALACANDYEWDVLEINGSERPKAKEIDGIIGNGIHGKPFTRKTLILIEECDGLSKAAFAVIEELIDQTVNPVILTCNDEYGVSKLTSYIRENSLRINFRRLSNKAIKSVAETVLQKEGLKQDELDKLIDYSHGDLRYVLNNLTVIEPVPRHADDIVFGIVHDIFRGEWNGDTSGVELDLIWYTVKLNIYNFYNDIDGMPVPVFIDMVDRHFQHLNKLKYRGDAPQAYQLWPIIMKILRMMPLHQKTAKIVLHKSEISNAKIPRMQEFARDLHMSYRKASTQFDYMREMFDIWKAGPKEKPKPIQPEVTTKQAGRSLFSFASQSTPLTSGGSVDQ